MRAGWPELDCRPDSSELRINPELRNGLRTA
jgi:hypothetical protein